MKVPIIYESHHCQIINRPTSSQQATVNDLAHNNRTFTILTLGYSLHIFKRTISYCNYYYNIKMMTLLSLAIRL